MANEMKLFSCITSGDWHNNQARNFFITFLVTLSRCGWVAFQPSTTYLTFKISYTNGLFEVRLVVYWNKSWIRLLEALRNIYSRLPENPTSLLVDPALQMLRVLTNRIGLRLGKFSPQKGFWRIFNFGWLCCHGPPLSPTSQKCF